MTTHSLSATSGNATSWLASSGPGSGGGGGGGGLSEEKVTHFYYQVLADSFAKDLPGIRRAEEQLAALAGKWLMG